MSEVKSSRVDRVCKTCSKQFSVPMYHFKKSCCDFCSRKCLHEHMRSLSIYVTCQRCGKSFATEKNILDKGKGKFCSKKCLITPPTDIKTAFWSQVVKHDGDGCWEWTGNKSRSFGYGSFAYAGTTKAAHRVSWEMHNGPIQVNSEIRILVCHKCDNPPCVRPDHLFLGTDADNNKDNMLKGRCRPRVGSSQWKTRHTEAEVIEMRRLFSEGVSKRSIADRFGLTMSHLGFILRRKTWKHI